MRYPSTVDLPFNHEAVKGHFVPIHSGTPVPEGNGFWLVLQGSSLVVCKTGEALTLPRNEIVDKVKNSGLRGRGGAGFSCGLKWSFIKPDEKRPAAFVGAAAAGERDHRPRADNRERSGLRVHHQRANARVGVLTGEATTRRSHGEERGPREVGFQLTFGSPVGSPEVLDLANSRVITTADELSQETINLKR